MSALRSSKWSDVSGEEKSQYFCVGNIPKRSKPKSGEYFIQKNSFNAIYGNEIFQN